MWGDDFLIYPKLNEFYFSFESYQSKYYNIQVTLPQ
jgi:hypothetical protein